MILKGNPHADIFQKMTTVGRGGGDPGIFWFLFIFSLKSSALDHSATAPLSIHCKYFTEKKHLIFLALICCR